MNFLKEAFKDIFYLKRANSGLGYAIPLSLFAILGFVSFIVFSVTNYMIWLILTVIFSIIVFYLLYKRVYTICWKGYITDDYGLMLGFLSIKNIFSNNGSYLSFFSELLFWGRPKKEYIETSPKYQKMQKEKQERIKKIEELKNQPFEEAVFYKEEPAKKEK